MPDERSYRQAITIAPNIPWSCDDKNLDRETQLSQTEQFNQANTKI